TALPVRAALHDGLRVRGAPAGIVHGDRPHHGCIKLRKLWAIHLCCKLAGQRGVRGLGNQPATVVNLALVSFHYGPCRDKFRACGWGRLQGTQNHQLERLLAMRRGTAMALAGPLLEGGFFIPSRSSLSATALLRSTLREE